MRAVLGFLLIACCVPCGSAFVERPVERADIAGLAGVPIRVFDLREPDVTGAFREFMATVPMTNDRPVPDALIADTVASLSFLRAATPPGTPAYFVAAYINKTPLVPMENAERSRYLARYGEAVYPQRVCPVFLSPAGGAPELLSAATNLPRGWFAQAPADAVRLEHLFALTEASHCGFIARELTRPTVLPPAPAANELRSILEALGDFEATAVVRGGGGTARADAADVLFAARLLAAFLLDRENAYTPVPALIHEYRRIGVGAANREIGRILESTRLARHTVRGALGLPDDTGATGPAAVRGLAARLDEARAAGRLATGDRLADTLVAGLPQALRLLGGDRRARVFPRERSLRPALITLAGG